jgi:hypothetical protein
MFDGRFLNVPQGRTAEMVAASVGQLALVDLNIP